jgi:hypothetical protein
VNALITCYPCPSGFLRGSTSSAWGKHPIGSDKNTHIVLYDFSKRLC